MSYKIAYQPLFHHDPILLSNKQTMNICTFIQHWFQPGRSTKAATSPSHSVSGKAWATPRAFKLKNQNSYEQD
jgi:hypothetical protein